MYVEIFSGAVVGISAVKVTVEVNVTPGNYGMTLVGLPDNAIKESVDRVSSAVDNSKCQIPRQKCVVNLAPASLRKEGSGYDLPIAVGLLAASNQMMVSRLRRTMVVGELSLDGSVRGVSGVLPMVAAAVEMGFERIILPHENGAEASVVEGIEILGVRHLSEVVAWANGRGEIERVEPQVVQQRAEQIMYADDFADVKGQSQVKRAFEIAAAGGHNIIMIGAPGSGKTMLSKRLPTILPPMTQREAMETMKIYSVAGKIGVGKGLMSERPFRAPHHMTSQVAIVGGGSSPQPGEVSLANNGILFLDELPEFNRSVLEVLRQPLEDKSITISRARYTVDYPANFTLVASMNPCPCGYYNHPTKECTCSSMMVHKYLNRISGPLLDRIDLHVEVAPVTIGQIGADSTEERSEEIRKRVVAAREVQRCRFEGIDGVETNAMMSSQMLRDFAPLEQPSRKLLEMAMEKLQLSARAYDRIIKVARTIADLDGAEMITSSHISEAIGYRSLDRESWGRK